MAWLHSGGCDSMTDFPDWMLKDLTNPHIDTPGPRIRLRGQASNPTVALEDFRDVLEHSDPPGYVLSYANLEAEHSRGKRLTWQVVWLREEVAERRYQEKQAALMSRFTQEES